MIIHFDRVLSCLAMLLGTGLLVTGILAGDPTPAHAGCPALAAVAHTAVTAQDVDQLRVLHDEAQRDLSCDGVFRQKLGQALALALARRAAGVDEPTSRMELLNEALAYARPWQVLAALGDLFHEQHAYDRAVAFYQEALTVLNDPGLTPHEPSLATVERLFRLAVQSRLLATDYVGTPVTRAGTPGGLAAPRFRGGFVPVAVPVPIRFAYNADRFTEAGLKAAEDLLEHLTQEGAPAIRLAGHTSPEGGDAFNCALSRRRAEALGNFLRTRGYAGLIEITAMGKREPLELVNANHYTQTETYEMLRRVELIRLSVAGQESGRACPL